MEGEGNRDQQYVVFGYLYERFFFYHSLRPRPWTKTVKRLHETERNSMTEEFSIIWVSKREQTKLKTKDTRIRRLCL